MRRILIVDDERNVHYSFRRALEGEFEVLSAHDGVEALERLSRDAADVVLLDVKLPRLGGLEALEQIRKRHPHLPVVVMTAFGTTETAIRATALAARDYLPKPIEVPALKKLLNEILPEQAPAPEIAPGVSAELDLVGHSLKMHELYKLIGRAAGADATVLVTGESGTGKELVARAIHDHGRRKDGPLVAVNCAAIPDSLLESELFGHERGAFTGADGVRPGKFELAHRGTLLLDEIGEMASALQAKLLRVLQGSEVTRLGGSTPQTFDARVIAVTNADLESRVASGAFREDLYYRLNVFRIHVPPLRERGSDVLLLARYFVRRERARLDRLLSGFTPEAERRLLDHPWPGNVRELENVIAQACLKVRGERIRAEDLAIGTIVARSEGSGTPPSEDPIAFVDYAVGVFLEAGPERALETLERLAVARALAATGGNQVRAAKLLGTTRNVVRKRIARYTL